MAAACGDRHTGVMSRPPRFSRIFRLRQGRAPVSTALVSTAAVVRRHRLAELRVAGRRPPEGDRYGHIKPV